MSMLDALLALVHAALNGDPAMIILLAPFLIAPVMIGGLAHTFLWDYDYRAGRYVFTPSVGSFALVIGWAIPVAGLLYLMLGNIAAWGI